MAKTVTHDQQNESLLGEEKLLVKAQEVSFAALIYELLSEKKPTPEEAKIFELVLNLSIDHGEDTPSAVETIKAAKEGKTISESLAAGILQINDKHGGAIEPAMKFLYDIQKDRKSITNMVNKYLAEKKIIGGFGHRIYKTSDPRADLIFEKMGELGIGGDYLMIMVEIQNEIEKNKGLRLPINIDGAIAIVLCGLGWDPSLGNAVFLVARTPGLLAHYINNSKKA